MPNRNFNTTAFLNVDLDIYSRWNPQPLLKALGRKVLVLHAGRHGRGYAAHVELLDYLESLGQDPPVLDAKQVVEMEPGVRMDVAGAVYFPKDCHLTPSKFMRAMQKRVEELGVKLVWSKEVRGWKTSGRKVVAAILVD